MGRRLGLRPTAGSWVGDVAFEPCGELRRAVGARLDDTVAFGLGAGAVCAVPDGAQLAADGFAGGGAGGVVDGVAGEVELAALPPGPAGAVPCRDWIEGPRHRRPGPSMRTFS